MNFYDITSIFIAIFKKKLLFPRHVKLIDVALIDRYTCIRVKSALHVEILPVFDSNVACTTTAVRFVVVTIAVLRPSSRKTFYCSINRWIYVFAWLK